MKTFHHTARSLSIALLTAFFMTWTSEHTARAQTPRPPVFQFEQVVLTEETLAGFLDSFPKFRAMEKKYGNESSPGANPMDSLSAFSRHRTARRELDAILQAHGYKDMAEWLKVAQTVALTYSAVKSGKKPGEMTAQARRALAEIDNNPQLSAEQKTQIKAMMKRQMSLIAKMEPRPDNVALVKSMLPQIAAVMDAN